MKITIEQGYSTDIWNFDYFLSIILLVCGFVSLYNLCSSDLFKHYGNLKTMTRTLKSREFAPIYEIATLLRSVCISNISFAILVLLGNITRNWNSFPDVLTILKGALEGMVKLLLLFLLINDSSERGDSDDKLCE